MNEYDDLDIYNCNAVHDMEVDFDFHINTGKLPECFEDTDIETFIDNFSSRCRTISFCILFFNDLSFISLLLIDTSMPSFLTVTDSKWTMREPSDYTNVLTKRYLLSRSEPSFGSTSLSIT